MGFCDTYEDYFTNIAIWNTFLGPREVDSDSNNWLLDAGVKRDSKAHNVEAKLIMKILRFQIPALQAKRLVQAPRGCHRVLVFGLTLPLRFASSTRIMNEFQKETTSSNKEILVCIETSRVDDFPRNAGRKIFNRLLVPPASLMDFFYTFFTSTLLKYTTFLLLHFYYILRLAFALSPNRDEVYTAPIHILERVSCCTRFVFYTFLSCIFISLFFLSPSKTTSECCADDASFFRISRTVMFGTLLILRFGMPAEKVCCTRFSKLSSRFYRFKFCDSAFLLFYDIGVSEEKEEEKEKEKEAFRPRCKRRTETNDDDGDDDGDRRRRRRRRREGGGRRDDDDDDCHERRQNKRMAASSRTSSSMRPRSE